jgi:predicted ester cyclase
MTKAERYQDLANRLFHLRDLGAIDALFAEHYEGEYAGTPVHGRAAFRASVEGMLAALANTRYDVIETVESGDLLWAYWRCTGVHRGPMFGIAATNAPVVIEGITLNRFEGDRIVWGRVKWDRLAVAEQLKALAR